MEDQLSRRRRAAVGFVLTALGAVGTVTAILLSAASGRVDAQVPGLVVVVVEGNQTCGDRVPPCEAQ